MIVDPELLQILRCPLCHAEVEEVEETSELVCVGCGHRYPVDDHGIPDMVVDDDR